MKFFNLNKRFYSAPKPRPLNPQPFISPLESRRLMSIAAPVFSAFSMAADSHAQMASYHSTAIAHAMPAFGQVLSQDIPMFAGNMNSFDIPAGLIGGNITAPHDGAGFSGLANFAFTNTNDIRADAVVPAIGGSVLNSADNAAVLTTTATPGTGLTSLVQQIAPPGAALSATTANPTVGVSNAMTGLNDATALLPLVASTALHTQATAIAAKLENLLAILGTSPEAAFQPVAAPLPQIPGTPTVAPDSPNVAPVPLHIFSDSAVTAENFAKSAGEAFLENIASDLVRFETGLNSAVTQLGHSMNLKEAAIAAAAIALGAYLQQNNVNEEKKVDDSWLFTRISAR